MLYRLILELGRLRRNPLVSPARGPKLSRPAPSGQYKYRG